MGDSTEMTIEFLRARLLSERSVSRAARQRADQLAKRVIELEEQLRIVTIQRKKAEKAAAEIVAILETQGIGDLSESIDSSSNGEVSCGDTLKEYESSTASRMERSEVEDGSEPEDSLSQGRSLSWRSHSNSPDSRNKQRTKQIRLRQRRRSFMSTLQSSLNHELGKSCRKIKRKDVGSAADNERQEPTLLDAQENRGTTFSNYCDDQPEVSLETTRGLVGEAVADTSNSHHIDDHNIHTEALPCANGSGRDEEMERVLEKQAKLIVQFQEEEIAQREWEEKYNENKISTLADCESASQFVTAEKSSRYKKEFSDLADRTLDYDEEAIVRAVDISSTEERIVESLSSSNKKDISKETSNEASSNGSMPRDTVAASSNGSIPRVTVAASSNGSIPRVTVAASTGKSSSARGDDLVGHQHDATAVKETKIISQEFTEHYGMIRNGKQNEVMPRDAPNGYPSNSASHPHGNSIIENTSLRISFPIDDPSKTPKLGPQQINQMRLQGQLPQASSKDSRLGGVLEALQRAKLSLNQELSKRPSQSQHTLALAALTSSRARVIASADGLDRPIGSASLFRLPTDPVPPAQSMPEFYGSGINFPANRPDVGYPVSVYGYQTPSSTSYVDGRSRFVPVKEYFNNSFGSSMGMPGSNKYSRASSDLSTERASFRSESSKSYSDARNGMPPGDR